MTPAQQKHLDRMVAELQKERWWVEAGWASLRAAIEDVRQTTLTETEAVAFRQFFFMGVYWLMTNTIPKMNSGKSELTEKECAEAVAFYGAVCYELELFKAEATSKYPIGNC